MKNPSAGDGQATLTAITATGNGLSDNTRNVLWTTLLDWNNNKLTNRTCAGPGCGYYESNRLHDTRVNFLCVGYSYGSCIVWDADAGRVITFINTQALGTVLSGMTIKAPVDFAVEGAPVSDGGAAATNGSLMTSADLLAEIQKYGQTRAGVHEEDVNKDNKPPGEDENSNNQFSEGGGGGSVRYHNLRPSADPINDQRAPQVVTVDCAVGIYEPTGAYLIGACSDRYLKIWDCRTGACASVCVDIESS